MQQHFWMVWSPSGHAPTRRHLKWDSARVEAERLAGLNPGKEFWVLEAVGSCRKASVDWQMVPGRNDDVPF
jgi:hypothetical protein